MLRIVQFVVYLVMTLAFVAPPGLCQVQEEEPPQIIAVDPNRAITTPGAKVMVTGVRFSPDSVVYIGGLQAREVTFINSSALQAVTPYLRPGTYKLDLKSGSTVLHSETTFVALPAPVDSTIDQAEVLADKHQTPGAISNFAAISKTESDYDVRAYAHYRASLLYLTAGNYWEAGVESALVWDAKVSHGVHSSWQYRLLSAEMDYAVSESNRHDTDIGIIDAAIKWDITESSELHFWRALISARFGEMEQAKADLNLILGKDPTNVSYRALAAYIGVLGGDKSQLDTFAGEHVTDERALRLLGQGAYMLADYDAARTWWSAYPKAGKSPPEMVWARLDYMAGQKHLHYGQTRVGAAMVAECAAITPDSREGKAAKDFLVVEK